MLKVVLDSNVLVAWFSAQSGTLFVLRTHWRAASFQFVLSEHILAEVGRAWMKPYWQAHYTLEDITQRLRVLLQAAELTQLDEVVSGAAVHPEDDLMLATAASAGADYLVTGDKQLRSIGKYGRTRIVTPSEFIEVLEHRPERPNTFHEEEN